MSKKVYSMLIYILSIEEDLNIDRMDVLFLSTNRDINFTENLSPFSSIL